MTPEDFDKQRDDLIADQDKWREKHMVWLSTYYGGLLAALSLIAAIVQFIRHACPNAAILPRLISILCVAFAAIVILRIRSMIELYRALGFDRLPNKPEDIPEYKWRTEQEQKRFNSRAWLYVAYERAAFVFPFIIFALFALLVWL